MRRKTVTENDLADAMSNLGASLGAISGQVMVEQLTPILQNIQSLADVCKALAETQSTIIADAAELRQHISGLQNRVDELERKFDELEREKE